MEEGQDKKRKSSPKRTSTNLVSLPDDQIDNDRDGEEQETASASDGGGSELSSDEDDKERPRGKKAAGGGAKKKTKRSTFRSVYFDRNYRTKPWRAQISIHGHIKHLGYYATEEEAAEVFRQAARERDKTTKKKSSKYTGVRLDKKASLHPWVARITVHGKYKHLGCFAAEEEAARAYDKAARLYQKDRARLNFPDSAAASGGGGRVEGGMEDTDESSDDDEEEEMDEDESTSNAMSSDDEEKGKALMRSKARAMVGPAIAAGRGKEEDYDMKSRVVPVKAMMMTKRSEREEENETGGDSTARRQKKPRGEERSRNHHGHGDLQDSHKEEKKAKADGGGGGGGRIATPSSRSSSSRPSIPMPRQILSMAPDQSTSITVTSSNADSSGGGRAVMSSKATAVVSPEGQARAISSTASSRHQQPSTSSMIRSSYDIDTDNDSDDSSVVVIAPQAKPASSSKSGHSTITQNDGHVKPSAVTAKTSKGSDKAKEEYDAQSEMKVKCEDRPRNQHDRETPRDDDEKTSSHGSRSSTGGGGIATNGRLTGGGLLVPSSIPPSSAGSPASAKASPPPTAAVQSTTAAQAFAAPSVDELRKRAIGILSAELKDAMMAGDTTGKTQRLRKAITSIVKGAMDQLLEGMFVAGPMRLEEEVSREALVGLLLDLA